MAVEVGSGWQVRLEAIRASERQRLVCAEEQTELFFPEPGEFKSVVILLHGLNNKPSGTNDMARALVSRGFAVVRGGLTGHGGDSQSFFSVHRELWLAETYALWSLARDIAAPQGVAVSAMGFSLGALLLSDLATARDYEDVRIDRMVMLAPAISVRPFVNLLRLLRPFLRLTIPSANRMELRANREGSPIAAYNALFESIDALKIFGFARLKFKSLIFLDEKDEFISSSGLRRLLTMRSARDWSLEYIRAGSDATLRGNHHAIFQSRLVGEKLWSEMMEKSAAFLLIK